MPHGRLKLELQYSLLLAVGNLCLHESRVRIRAQLDKAQFLLVSLSSNLLYFIGLRILNEDDIFARIVQPAGQEQLLERRTLNLGQGRFNEKKRIVFPHPGIAFQLEADRNLLARIVVFRSGCGDCWSVPRI